MGKGQHENPGVSIRSAFSHWKHAVEKFSHSAVQYHKNSMLCAESFLQVILGKAEDIASQLDRQRSKGREENRNALRPIVETIIFCGENELPLRGSEDSEPLSLQNLRKKMWNSRH